MLSGKVQVRRSVAEKRRIVELTYVPGMSVARVAQAEGINFHPVFQWLRAYGDVAASRQNAIRAETQARAFGEKRGFGSRTNSLL
jgi:transposase-like protein